MSGATPDQRPDWIEPANNPIGSLADRDYIYMLELAFDPASQFCAIYGLLARNQKADDELVAEIRAAEEHAKKLTGIWNDHAVEECIDLMHHSVYQDATHSMSALGMLAPFIEGILAQCFAGIGRKFFTTARPPSTHDRWKLVNPRAWDCHYQHVGGKKPFKLALVAGSKQLAEETGLQKYLPADFWTALTAMFTYRNAMFHNGMEWPEGERKRFQGKIAANCWPPMWFSQATSGGEPWVFYMTQDFIEHCYGAANRLLDAFGLLIKNDLWPQQ